MKKKLTFTNGKEISVPIDVANTIRDKIIEGSPKFQCFAIGGSGDVTYLINVSEILCII